MLKKFHDKNVGRAALLSRLMKADQSLDQRRVSLRTQMETLKPLEPSYRLMECAAYLADCADRSAVPEYFDAHERGFNVTGAALSTAVRDVFELKWAVRGPKGEVIWDGHSPLADLAAKREKPQGTRGLLKP